MPGSRDQRRRDRRARQAAEERWPGFRLVPHASADMMPCGCRTHSYFSIDAAPLLWAWIKTRDGERYLLQCATCELLWTWPIPALPGKYNRLCVIATDPGVRSLCDGPPATSSSRSRSRRLRLAGSTNSRRS